MQVSIFTTVMDHKHNHYVTLERLYSSKTHGKEQFGIIGSTGWNQSGAQCDDTSTKVQRGQQLLDGSKSTRLLFIRGDRWAGGVAKLS